MQGIQIQVFVLPAGKIQVFVDGPITFAQARNITAVVIERLQAQGIAFSEIGIAEQHKDGVAHVHIHQGVHHEHRH